MTQTGQGVQGPRRWALTAFGRLPAPVRRLAVRLGTPSFTVGTVCVLEHDGAVLLLRQLHRDDWGFPGGLLDRGETPAEAVRRELREEIGLHVDVGLPAVTQLDPQTRRIDVVFHVPCTRRPDVRPRGEALESRWMHPEELGEDSEMTAGLLALLEAARRPGAYSGRVLP